MRIEIKLYSYHDLDLVSLYKTGRDVYKRQVYSDEGLQDNKICKKCTYEVRESS